MNRALALLAPVVAVLLLAGGCSPSKETCLSPRIECNGKCVDAARDPANCGNCGVTCGASQTCCGGCVDLQTNDQNCGACGARCPTGGSCSGGACSCPPAQPTACGTSPGKCVDLDTDPSFCGTCTQACWSPLLASTTDATCSSGGCTCSGSATACPGSPECRNTQVDPTACGGCGNVCAPHATCASGACACGNAAFPDRCPATGTITQCVNFATDAANCGSCGHACAAGQTCCSGTCVSTQTSATDCGACGNACPAGQACSAGSCGCSGAKPLACGGTCCAGTACCGSACQTQHDNGLGGHFFDCNLPYTPGPTGTTTMQAATAAAGSWSLGTTIPGLCDAFCIGQQTPTSCAVWCFAPSLNAGHVTSGPTVNCPALCLNFTGVTPTWQ